MYSWGAARLERRGDTSTPGRVAQEEAKGLVKDVRAEDGPPASGAARTARPFLVLEMTVECADTQSGDGRASLDICYQ